MMENKHFAGPGKEPRPGDLVLGGWDKLAETAASREPLEAALRKSLAEARERFSSFRIYLACSGGVDSMALATGLFHVLEKETPSLGTPKPRSSGLGVASAPSLSGAKSLTLVHLNHGLRGQAAEEDAKFVRAWALAHGWNFASRKLSLAALAKAKGDSIETAGRKARYQFFSDLVQRDARAGNHAPALFFLAHHFEDQTESILLHLLRGAGTEGLIGMETLEERADYLLLRPLLSFSKESLRSYLVQQGETWREDATNQEDQATRNFLRLEILPKLRKRINPKLDQALMRTGEILQSESDYLNRQARALLAQAREAAQKNPISARNARLLGAKALDKKSIQDQDLALQRRTLRLWLREELDKPLPSYQQVEELRQLFFAPAGKKTRLYGMIFLCDSRAVYALDLAAYTQVMEAKAFDFTLPLAQVDWPIRLDLTASLGGYLLLDRLEEGPSRKEMEQACQKETIYLDGRELESLRLRTPKTGDLFTKWSGGSKPLRRLWQEWELPEILRKSRLLVFAGGDLLWVPGFARSGLRPVTQAQGNLKMEWRKA